MRNDQKLRLQGIFATGMMVGGAILLNACSGNPLNGEKLSIFGNRNQPTGKPAPTGKPTGKPTSGPTGTPTPACSPNTQGALEPSDADLIAFNTDVNAIENTQPAKTDLIQQLKSFVTAQDLGLKPQDLKQLAMNILNRAAAQPGAQAPAGHTGSAPTEVASLAEAEEAAAYAPTRITSAGGSVSPAAPAPAAPAAPAPAQPAPQSPATAQPAPAQPAPTAPAPAAQPAPAAPAAALPATPPQPASVATSTPPQPGSGATHAPNPSVSAAPSSSPSQTYYLHGSIVAFVAYKHAILFGKDQSKLGLTVSDAVKFADDIVFSFQQSDVSVLAYIKAYNLAASADGLSYTPTNSKAMVDKLVHFPNGPQMALAWVAAYNSDIGYGFSPSDAIQDADKTLGYTSGSDPVAGFCKLAPQQARPAAPPAPAPAQPAPPARGGGRPPAGH